VLPLQKTIGNIEERLQHMKKQGDRFGEALVTTTPPVPIVS
jgi:hypothetical protein